MTRWTSRKAPLQEVTHVGVDVLIGRAAEAMVLVRVPLKEGKKLIILITLNPIVIPLFYVTHHRLKVHLLLH